MDPNDSLHVIAADLGNNAMVVTDDGGLHWHPDDALTALVTDHGVDASPTDKGRSPT